MERGQISAPVFNIVHGSMVDGWGLRTTVFLKGCPLQCLWCCNPEGQKKILELKYSVEDCNGCGNCVGVCPRGAIEIAEGSGRSVARINRTSCYDCLLCKEVCYTGALTVFGKEYTVEELFRAVAKDQSYFGIDGGVTIGGGEATVHAEFTLAFIRKCKENYIHTALDTCGYITTEEGLKALEEADLVLYDIKGMDEKTHIEATGVSNRIIHENLLHRDSIGKEIIIRLPIIPGYTDTEENLRATAEYLKPMEAIKRIDILPLHKYSEVKYRNLGRSIPDVFSNEIPVERENELIEFFRGYGFNAQIDG